MQTVDAENQKRAAKKRKRTLTVRDTEGSINDLIHAVNFNIPTNDLISEGDAAEVADGGSLVIIPLSKTNAEDQADADRLQQRVTQVQHSGVVAITLGRHADVGAFDYLLMKLAVEDARPLAYELVKEMGGKGWEMLKGDTDMPLPGLREKILSGRGLTKGN